MNTQIKEEIAAELRKIRAGLNLSLEDVSTKSGVNKDTICRYENNQVNMNIDILFKILCSYGIDFYIFFKSINANKQNTTPTEISNTN